MEDFTADLSIYLAGLVAHYGELRAPVSAFQELTAAGVLISFDASTDEIVFLLDEDGLLGEEENDSEG